MAFDIEEIRSEVFPQAEMSEHQFVQVANEPSGHVQDAFAKQGEYGIYNDTKFPALIRAKEDGIDWIS